MYTIADIKQSSPVLKDESLYTIDQLNRILSEVGESQIQPSSSNYNVLADDKEVLAKNLNSIKAALLILKDKWPDYEDSELIKNIELFMEEVLDKAVFANGGEIGRYAVMDSAGVKIGSVLSYSEPGAHFLVTERHPDHIPGNYSLNFEGMEAVTAKHFAQGGSVGVVGAFLRSVDLDALPPKVAHHIKTELLSDPDIELLLSDDDGREKFELIKNLLQPYVKKATSEEPKPHDGGVDTETAKAEQQAKEKALADRLELLREMLEEDKDNDTLKDRIELLEEMLTEQVGERSKHYGSGGKTPETKEVTVIGTGHEKKVITVPLEAYDFEPHQDNKNWLTYFNPEKKDENDYDYLEIEDIGFPISKILIEKVVIEKMGSQYGIYNEAGQNEHGFFSSKKQAKDFADGMNYEIVESFNIGEKYKFGGMIDETKLKYQDIYTGLTYTLDITKSRHEFALAAAEKYVKDPSTKRKKVTPKVIEFFEHDAGAYHAVRDIIESVVVGERSNPETFDKAVEVFKKYYPLASKDWKAALETGLLVKAGDRQYASSPYYFTQPLAEEIREARLGNALREIINNKILEPAMA